MCFIMTGKKGRAVVGKQGTKSMLSLECSASLLRVLFWYMFNNPLYGLSMVSMLLSSLMFEQYLDLC